MKCIGPSGLVLLSTLALAYSMPTETTTTTRSTPKRDSINVLSSHLTEVNATSLDMIYDVRTPPKVRQQQKNKMKVREEMEPSHAGVAIPIDDDLLEMEEATKKMNFYKIEKPTTNSGISTWILLSGQSTMTTKPPTRKPTVKPPPDEQTKLNVTLVSNENPNRIIKPIFKKRITTTTTSTTTPSPTTTLTTTAVKINKETNKLTKIKASILNNALNKKNFTSRNDSLINKTNDNVKRTTEHPITISTPKTNITLQTSTISTLNSTASTVEAKEGEVELPNDSDKKKKGTNKRKKNKNKRRKTDKNGNNTSLVRPTKVTTEKPMGTQLYNYLSKEIMPTVGMGLVGLMVTAGLASYFFFPFGAARRNYDIDRRDKNGAYYYSDAYSGGILEEDAIGKVIAGMPTNNLFDNSYKTPSTRNTYSGGAKYKLADRKAQIQPQYYDSGIRESIENVPTVNKNTYDDQKYRNDYYDRITYTKDVDSSYSTTNDKKFVVGNVPKETLDEVTPASVPEHGPRNLRLNLEEIHAQEPSFVVTYPEQSDQNPKTDKLPAHRPRNLRIRRKRSEMSNDIDNEIIPSDKEEAPGFTTEITSEIPQTTNAPAQTQTTTLKISTTTEDSPQKFVSFIDMLKNLIHFKAKLGLEVIQNATQSFSNYISRVQSRLNLHDGNSRKCKN